MKYLKNKKSILIGYGGMGKRYFKALKSLGFKVTYVCEKDKNKIDMVKKTVFTDNYKNLLKKKADLVCIVANTTERYKILINFLKNSPIKNIITEKPFTCSISEAYKLKKIIKNSKKKLIINSYRNLLNNYIQIEKILKKEKEDLKSINVISPSAGLGNMGSVFFDLSLYFFKEKPKSIYCKIDKSNTINPRGKIFKDPGGYGIVNFKNNKRLFFDLSEDTGMPYTIILKSKNIEFIIDELNNIFYYKKRPKKLKLKPLYYYLFKPEYKRLNVYEKYNPINFTKKTIQEIFKSNFKNNINRSIDTMKLIIGCHCSDKQKKEIKIKDLKNNNTYVPFA